MAFQNVLERVYDEKSGGRPTKRNAFQNLERADELWKEISGSTLSELLTREEREILQVGFQRRHLLAHNDGVVDTEYVQKSGDVSYAVGQRLPLNADYVGRFIDAVDRAVQLATSIVGVDLKGSEEVKDQDLTDTLNLLTPPLSVKGISKRLGLSEIAATVARTILEASSDGLRDPIEFNSIEPLLPDIDYSLLEEAVFELKEKSLVSVSPTLSHVLHNIIPEYDLFWKLDPLIAETDPIADAVELAQMILQNDKLWGAAELHKEAGWSKRRFNPALARLVPEVEPGRVRRFHQPDYVVGGFVIDSEDRYRLKRFISSQS